MCLGSHANHVSSAYHRKPGPSAGHRKCVANIQPRSLRRTNQRIDPYDRLLQNDADILSVFHTNAPEHVSRRITRRLSQGHHEIRVSI